jgi:glycosyltransferase involved in cell wall biosynthesis
MKIVHLVSSLDQGGIERLLVSMSPYWNFDKYNISVWCLNVYNTTELYIKQLNDYGIDVITIGKLRREHIELSLPWRIAVELKRQHISIVHSHTPYPLFVGLLARHFINKDIIHIHHQHSPLSRQQTISMLTLGRAKPLQGVIAVSKSTASELHLALPRLSCPIETIFNGIELPTPDSTPLPTKSLHKVITVARLTKQKNIELLLLAMSKVIQKSPKITLTILGDGELRPELESRAEQLGIHRRVTFSGYVLDPRPYLSSHDVFVLPSLWEPFGLALIEAMAHGKPCIATAVGGMREIVDNEINGLLVPSNDVDAIANAILRVIGDPLLATRLGQEAITRAQAFHIRETVRHVESFYERFLNTKRQLLGL